MQVASGCRTIWMAHSPPWDTTLVLRELSVYSLGVGVVLAHSAGLASVRLLVRFTPVRLLLTCGQSTAGGRSLARRSHNTHATGSLALLSGSMRCRRTCGDLLLDERRRRRGLLLLGALNCPCGGHRAFDGAHSAPVACRNLRHN